jgi:tRNA threonylcarbamoyladenosine biosynthesis protein TsaB
MTAPTEPGRPLLALETSVPTARVAVLDAGGAVRARAEKTAARHSSNLLRLCDEVLGASGLRIADLGAIACGAGPGSFTGLRVGLAVAKGLALPTGLPLVLVSSLEALARDLDAPDALVVPCLDAGKDQVYARLCGAATSEDWALEPAALIERIQLTAHTGPVVLGGTGADRYHQLFAAALGAEAIRSQVAGPSAISVGTLALERFRRGETDDLGRAVPSYGRPPDITTPKRNRL